MTNRAGRELAISMSCSRIRAATRVCAGQHRRGARPAVGVAENLIGVPSARVLPSLACST